ncbi:rab9 effector protein with kelch motifs [Cocos nucifera]|uniref:Rab9 effector protein with kelch motifs n=1 Tax=Cocos nucifera TaxID=13894 RepID=A0A8K0I7L8_COCNU|nr:rab9 effector protein with kelch motifs [Cocos nucifera]
MEVMKRRKAMWLYPKLVGFNPPERWGHSACFFEGVVYVFGGCCGGLHFSDVLTLDLDTMAWNSLVTTGQKPGSRDSHSTALVGHKMVVLGGTNGSRKVNDLHILDLWTKEWSKPNCKGTPPSPRESHTATVVGDDKLVIFGGSGEGEANYLNDVHILDLKSMTWTSPEVKGDSPAPRDSHTAVAVVNKLLIYGGDCGDRYHGEVDVFDIDTMTWSRVCIIGGVGDKRYYSDVWVLDLGTCLWAQLDILGQQPQGRFSHTAVVTGTDIAIYGGCGEDERPLNELLILQLGSEHPNGRCNISMCKIFGNHWNQEKRKFFRGTENLKNVVLKSGELCQQSREVDAEPRNSLLRSLDNMKAKRRKTGDARVWEIESEQEEHSLSLSQHSSPSQSDQEQNAVKKLSTSANDSILASQQFVHFKLHHQREPLNGARRTILDGHISGGESPRQPKTTQFLHAFPEARQEVQFLAVDQKPQPRPAVLPLIGAEVHGMVDGAFDSGYLVTAYVNGQILRGVLFAPGPGVTASRPAIHSQCLTGSTAVSQHCSAADTHAIPIHIRQHPQPATFVLPECGHHGRQAHRDKVAKAQPAKLNSDVQGVVLTLGGPGGGSGP